MAAKTAAFGFHPVAERFEQADRDHAVGGLVVDRQHVKRRPLVLSRVEVLSAWTKVSKIRR